MGELLAVRERTVEGGGDNRKLGRPGKGARLHKYKHRDQWYILDTGCKPRSTGCTSRREAEKVLSSYIATRGRYGAASSPDRITVAKILTIYAEEHAPTVADPERIGYAIEALLPFWGALTASEVKGATCRRYLAWRGKAPGTMRRELGTLRSALRYAAAEGYLTTAPVVTLPEKGEPRNRWLTREEAARLVWAAYRDGGKHVARFILIGLYTGTRKDAILRMGFEPNTVGGWFDLEGGLMFRKSDTERATKKRRTPARIPRQLAAHLRRWKAEGCLWAVEYRGARVDSIKTSFRRACDRAALVDVTPHTLKHTAITWTLQNGSSVWDAAGYFGTSAETIEKTYGHHSPDHQKSALIAIEKRFVQKLKDDD